MNFNIDEPGHDGEYNLFRSTTEEMIALYGVKLIYLITEKIQQDTIFGEHNSIAVNSENSFELYGYPETTDTWDGDGTLFSKFGLQNLETISFYISRADMEKIHPEIVSREGKATIDNLPHGNIISLPNNKLMEVTDMKLESNTFGNNNLYTSNKTKNVYKLTLKSYIANRDDYTKAQDISNSDEVEYEDFGNLEAIFNGEDEDHETVTKRAEERIIEDETIMPNEVRKKPIRQKVDSPFGDLG